MYSLEVSNPRICHLSTGLYYICQHELSRNWVCSYGINCNLNMTWNKTHSEISHLQVKQTYGSVWSWHKTIQRIRDVHYLIFSQKWRWNTPVLR
jgi:hypothetical protein